MPSPERKGRRPWLFLAVAVVLGLVPATAASTHPALDLLHEGRFAEAEARLDASGADRPEAETRFLRAFVTYWRLLYDPENPRLRDELESRLQSAVETAEQWARNRPELAAPRFWEGMARMLLAQLRVSQKEIFRGAYEAKRARSLLLEALERDPSLVDAYFGLGAYHYYASRVPAIVRGLRFLLGLPGGDRELGLRQLRQAAEQGRYFRLESGILLLTIRAGRKERDYAGAESLARRLLGRYPSEPPLALQHVVALLELSLARPAQAAARLDAARARARRVPGTEPTVLLWLDFHRLRADLAAFRPDRAAGRLAELERAYAGRVPPSVWKDVERMKTRLASWTDASALGEDEADGVPTAAPESWEVLWGQAIPALDLADQGAFDDAARLLARMLGEHAGDPALALIYGRVLLLDARPSEALAWLKAAERNPSLPPNWRGPARLMAGRASDLLGRRQGALGWYRLAWDSPPFVGREASLYHQQRPFTEEMLREEVAAIRKEAVSSGPRPDTTPP